jgi:hypothetical protein
LENSLSDHVAHLNSVYFTLHQRYGFDALQLPGGIYFYIKINLFNLKKKIFFFKFKVNLFIYHNLKVQKLFY